MDYFGEYDVNNEYLYSNGGSIPGGKVNRASSRRMVEFWYASTDDPEVLFINTVPTRSSPFGQAPDRVLAIIRSKTWLTLTLYKST